MLVRGRVADGASHEFRQITLAHVKAPYADTGKLTGFCDAVRHLPANYLSDEHADCSIFDELCDAPRILRRQNAIGQGFVNLSIAHGNCQLESHSSIDERLRCF